MSTEVLFGVLIASGLSIYGALAFTTWRRFRDTHVVTCPATGTPAAVTLDAGHAAATAVWETPDLKVEQCTCWPARTGCDQACATQIAADSEGTRALTVAVRHFQDKRCAICQCPIAPPKPGTNRPGLMYRGSHQVIAWDEVPPEHLPETFATCQPICAPCTRAESFRRRIDRPRPDRKPSPRL
jgi:hypothetical protein